MVNRLAPSLLPPQQRNDSFSFRLSPFTFRLPRLSLCDQRDDLHMNPLRQRRSREASLLTHLFQCDARGSWHRTVTLLPQHLLSFMEPLLRLSCLDFMFPRRLYLILHLLVHLLSRSCIEYITTASTSSDHSVHHAVHKIHHGLLAF